MAGDWIKMRVGLQHGDPHVVRLMAALNANKCSHQSAHLFATIGALHALWCVFDQYSADGKVSYTPLEMDTFIGWQGFTKAMIDVGWLEFNKPNTLIMHNFEAHNGKSAKRRASEAKRMADVRTDVRNAANELRTREEKKRYKTLTPPSPPKQGGLTSRQFKQISQEMRKIAQAMVGADYSVEDALRKACARAGVPFEKAQHMLNEPQE